MLRPIAATSALSAARGRNRLAETTDESAERAVRAALSIQRTLAELNRKNTGEGKPTLAAA
jgi:hypothetical protein